MPGERSETIRKTRPRRAADRILKLITGNRRALLEGIDESEWLKRTCEALIEACGYKMAWIGYTRNAEAHCVMPVAWAGLEDGYIGKLRVTEGRQEHAQRSTGGAIRSGQSRATRQTPIDPADAPTRMAVAGPGFPASTALPLSVAGQVIGALNIATQDEGGLGRHELDDLATLAEDISFGIAFLREKARNQEANRRAAEERDFHNRLLMSLQAMVIMLDDKANIVYVNPYLEKLSGYSLAEIKGKEFFSVLLPQAEWSTMRETFAEAIKTGAVSGSTSTLVTKDGGIRLTQWDANVMYDDQGRVTGALAVAMDITERRRIEQTLEKSESRLKEAQQIAHLGSWELDLVHDKLWWSDESYRIFGVEPGGEANYETFANAVHPDDRAFVNQAYASSVKDRKPYEIEHRINTDDGRIKWVHERCETFYAPDGTPLRSVGTTRDITEQKLAEEALRTSRDVLRSVIETAPMRVFWKDTDLRYLGCNTAFAHDAGLDRSQDLVGKDDYAMTWRDQAEAYRADDASVMESGVPKIGFEEPQTTPQGKRIWLRTSKVPMRDAAGKIFGLLGVYDDITQRHEMELALEHANRALQALSTVNRQLVHATDETELLQAICTVIAQNSGYGMAWVGYVEHDDAKSIKQMASAGDALDILGHVRPSWGENDHGTGPSGRAIRTGQTQVSADIAQDPLYESWKDVLCEQGWVSSIALPLMSGKEVFGVLHVYAEEVNPFTDTEVKLLEEMAEDLAFGVMALRTRHERDQAQAQDELHITQLRRNLNDTVDAIAKALEVRDPYTAGHQHRVADLASAIGAEMGLDDDMLDGIRIGATIHDLGKIQIPAELLAKPTKLTELEYKMLQEHPRVGYEILKDIDFPWPIAKIAYQHHERMDGSGYPQGLKGDEICLEARIVAVADVVEAMSSHRPYRPGKGIATALDEIRTNRGRFYDPVVVDACLSLFEKGFDLP